MRLFRVLGMVLIAVSVCARTSSTDAADKGKAMQEAMNETERIQ